MIFTFTNLGYAVQLTNGNTDILLRGNDAEIFLNEVDTLKDLWLNGNPNYFYHDSYEKHLKCLIQPYFYGVISYPEIIYFCKNLYPGDWWIDTSHERESFGVQTLIGNVKDANHSFQVFIDSDLEVNIDGYLLYQFTEEKDMSDAWVRISSDDKKAEIIFDDDNYPDKLREDLTNLIPKITEMINVISEFTEDLKG
jgi:hypothetical protein